MLAQGFLMINLSFGDNKTLVIRLIITIPVHVLSLLNPFSADDYDDSFENQDC